MEGPHSIKISEKKCGPYTSVYGTFDSKSDLQHLFAKYKCLLIRHFVCVKASLTPQSGKSGNRMVGACCIAVCGAAKEKKKIACPCIISHSPREIAVKIKDNMSD